MSVNRGRVRLITCYHVRFCVCVCLCLCVCLSVCVSVCLSSLCVSVPHATSVLIVRTFFHVLKAFTNYEFVKLY